jgi:hypothetical protein
MKRAVYQAIGDLDERFGLGFFDDDDLAERARRAGFSLAVAYDLFVHHFGSRTFAGAGIDAPRLLQENGRRYAEKWGSTSIGQGVMLRPWAEGDRRVRPQDAPSCLARPGDPSRTDDAVRLRCTRHTLRSGGKISGVSIRS